MSDLVCKIMFFFLDYLLKGRWLTHDPVWQDCQIFSLICTPIYILRKKKYDKCKYYNNPIPKTVRMISNVCLYGTKYGIKCRSFSMNKEDSSCKYFFRIFLQDRYMSFHVQLWISIVARAYSPAKFEILRMVETMQSLVVWGNILPLLMWCYYDLTTISLHSCMYKLSCEVHKFCEWFIYNLDL